jgi:hypothetical protein
MASQHSFHVDPKTGYHYERRYFDPAELAEQQKICPAHPPAGCVVGVCWELRRDTMLMVIGLLSGHQPKLAIMPPTTSHAFETEADTGRTYEVRLFPQPARPQMEKVAPLSPPPGWRVGIQWEGNCQVVGLVRSESTEEQPSVPPPIAPDEFADKTPNQLRQLAGRLGLNLPRTMGSFEMIERIRAAKKKQESKNESQAR